MKLSLEKEKVFNNVDELIKSITDDHETSK